jgi:hypothetical protein
VKKVFAALAPDKPGLVNLTPAQWAQPLGCSLAEQAARGRSLVLADVVSSPRTVGLSLLVNQLPQSSGKGDVMGGIALQFGSDARRLQGQPPAGDLKALAQLAQKRHLVDQLLERIDTDQTLGAGWLGQVSNLTQGLSAQQSGEIIWQLADKYHATGKGEQAAEALVHLLEKHPQHPLADAAARWLMLYYCSSEVAWRQRKETRYQTQVAAATADAPLDPAKPGSVAVAGFSAAAGPGLNPAQRAGRALALAKQIEQTRPWLFAEPELRFQLASASRQAGQPRSADRIFQLFTGSGRQSLWTQTALAEQWLIHPSQQSPKRVCSVVPAGSKPRLDGRLDEPVWQAAKPVALNLAGAPASQPSASAVLAVDEEFLYLAISCGKAPGVEYSTGENVPAEGRKADGDLSARDHVTLFLDVDRDYGSFWTLALDDRGWPAESCFGDRTWNPQWYIAAGGDEQFWTVEAAIPLAEICPQKPKTKDAWAIGIQRTIPRLGLQSFTAPAAIDPRPEGFGLLVFE